MSDQTLRELQRRFQETGAREDEAAWLAARLRVGGLTETDLRLAAWLGHLPAQDVVRQQPGLDAAVDRAWLSELRAFGPEACVRVGLAAARLVLPAWEAGVLHGAVARAPRRVLDAADAWLACPGAEHAERAVSTVLDVADELEEFVLEVGEEGMWMPLRAERAAAARAEYEREIEPQDPDSARPKQVAFFATADADDRCGLVLDGDGRPTGDVVSVHLTWSVEHDPRWPSTRRTDLLGWTRACATFWPAAMPIAAAQAALWAFAPATVEAYPVFNASAPVAYARLHASTQRVADAIRAEVLPTVLA